MQALLDHAGLGVTTLCRAWRVTRRDGVRFGFTDHDLDLRFEDMLFKASTGMSARALQNSTGLSVDNSEAIGALADAALEEADLIAGRFDAAEVLIWLVNWADPSQRVLQFRGSFGEISRAAGGFKAELRGLTESLNQPMGRIFQRSCSAVLGDARCGLSLNTPAFMAEVVLDGFDAQGRMLVSNLNAYADRWFERGRLRVQSGAAAGLSAVIKLDRLQNAGRVMDLTHRLSAPLQAGDLLRLEAGCDRTAATCKVKFGNFLNFRGFPHIPGEDWLSSYPISAGRNDGGSLT
ncbi:DUF2163 domain-containing protein [Cypionkella sp.]|uniref:DUF2163 domain-containing protein n=1 Tax=Cypionkella sp. TaxID=2811411 RepID=UPI0027609A21|nr:DUF2163 domain-containing protein [Cypionkella sp.]